MSQFFPGSGSGNAANANGSYEPIGFASDGSGTSVSNSSGNANGSASASLGTTAAAWSGFIPFLTSGSTAAARYMFGVSFDGGSTWAVTNVYFTVLSTGVMGFDRPIPIRVPAGSDVRVRVRISTASSMKVAILGIVSDAANVPPGFATFDALLADTTNTRPSTINVPLDSGAGSWTQLISSTANAYGAMLMIADGNGTNFANGQLAMVMLATGAAASEVEFARCIANVNTSQPTFGRGGYLRIDKSIPAGTRISGRIVAATPGSDNGRIGLYGMR